MGALIEAGLAQAFLAEWEGAPCRAGAVPLRPQSVVLLRHEHNEERQRIPTYLLQWEAIRWAQARGYRRMNSGAPDTFSEDDPMWGVYRFKDGIGGTVVRHIGAWDYVPNAAPTPLRALMPRILGAMKRLARRNG